MKTALVLTGHMRCWEQCFENTKERVLDRYNPDVFISTWDNEGYWTSPENDPDNFGINPKSPELDINGVKEAYDPIRTLVMKQSTYREKIESNGEKVQPFCEKIRAKNILSQFFLMHQGYMLMTGHMQTMQFEYDLVIRMRPDLVFPNGLPAFNLDKLNLIRHPNHEGRGYGDMFLASDVEKSLKFMNRINHEIGMFFIGGRKDRFCPHLLVEQAAHSVGEVRVMNVDKIIQHTPNGQYKDWKNEIN